MRKLLAWLLAALMALSGFAFAETAQEPEAQPTEAVELPTEPPLAASEAGITPNTGAAVSAIAAASSAAAAAAYNGRDAVRVGDEIYMAIPDGTRQMLVRVPVGGDPVCVDRGDRIEDLMPYANGVAYLKTENNSSAIMACLGEQLSSIYAFGASSASCLSLYDGKMLVLIDSQLHSIEPGTQLCLRMSGTQMLDYVVDGDSAYFLSAGDRMEYTATLGDGEKVATQAGCVYSLDLKTGETNLLLKTGVRDLQIAGNALYFHNLNDAYAVRTADSAELMGRVNGLDVRQHTLSDECSEADNGFWALDRGLVIWHSGALNVDTEAGNLALYNPEANATVASDGTYLYVWEPGKPALTQVELNGTATEIYSGDLTQAPDLSLLTPLAAAEQDPDASPSPTPQSDVDPDGGSGWFDEFMSDNGGSGGGSGSGSGSSGSAWPGATPIGTTPTPRPTATAAPTANTTTSGGSTSGGSSSGSSSGSGSSSSSGGSYSVNIKYLQITGDVNVRSGPSLNYRILTSVRDGSVVNCTGKASKDSRGRVWYRIKHNGVTGWISSAYAKKTSSSSGSSGSSGSSSGATSASGTRYTTGSVNFRTGPGLDYSSKGTIPAGTKVTLKQKATDGRGVQWLKVSYDGSTGWVSGRYLSKTKSSSEDLSSGSGGIYVVTTGSVTIRSSANKESASKGFIGSGKRVTYLGVSKKDSRGVRWYKIKYNGITGWISSKYAHRE